MFKLCRWLIAIGLACSLFLPANAHSEVLYRFSGAVLFDGKYGPVARAQQAASTALVACGKSPISADGKFGSGTRAALRTLAGCPAFQAKLAGDADARDGTLTDRYWAALIADAAPFVDARAKTIMLTFEATDYTRMEWNFCQSSPLYNPAIGNRVCYSNDPRSYLTWGPNGATGGGGREVQLILKAVDVENAAIVAESFGSEVASVRRMFDMPDRDQSRSLETFLCGIWADPGRRAAWKSAFEKLGQLPVVRKTFDDFYLSSSLDGGKIRTFVNAYAANGLKPTEIDYAFFKDRAAHTTPPAEAIRTAIANALSAEPGAERWKIRRAIALNVRPSNQRADRLGRDVTFYLDGAGLGQLSAEERNAWQSRGGLRASDAGLSDAREYGSFTPGAAINTSISQPATLTAAERTLCPAAVLATRQP